MSRLPSRDVRGAARAVAPTPLLAGFPPAAAALAVAAAFGLQVTPVRAQPVAPQVIAGKATFTSNGANLVVTTQNAAGSNHSAINWQSFSVPAGSTTSFVQPSATSTSINRVLGSDPSAIYGTLSSNGKLVLVNPAGITVGQGAVVDTAGFTASTLGMSEADAIVGRLRFSAGSSPGPLLVNGSIVARGGDVFLIATQVQTGANAVVEAQGGATVLAAGQKVELTGRGLEGIHLEVQAPQDSAVNLGTLKGDAIGMFAGTLKHSGLVQAQAVSTEGGKVVLRALGDNEVTGTITAKSADGKGGSVDVLGESVALRAGASIDASGATGGGQVRVGGDYQGLNAEVPNAKRTSVDAGATIRADATQAGNGGRVIVWSDEATRMDGQISARGGEQGGNGGFTEVSGKKVLAYTGFTDLRAPRGKAGQLLLDPEDVEIAHTGDTPNSDPNTSTLFDGTLSAQLAGADVLVTTSGGSVGPNGGQIHLLSNADVNWTADHTLGLQADKGIILDGTISASGAGSGLSMVAADGNITGSQTIQVGSLFASATQGASGSGGQVALSGSNRIGTIAGTAQGDNASFSVFNQQALTVGSVNGPYASGTGITVTSDGTNPAGLVNLVTDVGLLKVADGANISAGSVSLTAAAGDIQIGASTIAASTGDVVLVAGHVSESGGGGTITTAAGGRIDFAGNADIEADQGMQLDGALWGTGQASSLSLVAKDGGIVGGGVITTPFLFASATDNGGGNANAGKVQLTGANQVDTLAGVAGGQFSEFTFNNAKSLAIGQTPDNYASGNGILGDSATVVKVTTTGAGSDLTVADNAPVTAASITLSAARDLKVGGTSLQAHNGGLSLLAGQDVAVAPTVDSASTSLFGDQGLTIDAGRNVTVAPGTGNGSTSTYLSSNDKVTIHAVGDIAFGNSDTRNPSYVNLYGQKGVTAGGVAVTADNGSVDFGAFTNVNGYQSPIDITAGNSILGNGSFSSNGTLAGSIHLSATNGTISFNTINSSGSSGVVGGNVVVSAKGDVTGGSIFANGGYSYAGDGAAGGQVEVGSSAGSIRLDGASASGGSGYVSIGSGAGGAGGGLWLHATGSGGTVTVNGDLVANGGDGQQASGGAGGTIKVEAAGNIQLQNADANGGAANFDGTGTATSAIGGKGGTVSIASAGGSIALGQMSTDGTSISVYGGAMVRGGYGNSLAAGGGGGAIVLSAGGSGASILVTNSLDAGGASAGSQGGDGGSGGSITVTSGGTVNVLGTVEGSGGSGANGGSGGSVTVQGDKGVQLASVNDPGANAGSATGTGGSGGTVRLGSANGGVTVNGEIYAEGASGGLAGGNGGSVTISAATDISVSGAISLYGGEAIGINGTPDQVGQAGHGGQVNATSSSGAITLGSVTVEGGYGESLAAGGAGGSIVLNAGTNVNVSQYLEAGGGSGSQADGGQGGGIQVTAGGNINLIGASASGSSGGGGGAITLLAQNTAAGQGNVTVSGSLDVSGGSGASGSDGGSVTVRADKDVHLDTVNVAGGSASAATGSGGAGGTVVLASATGGVTVDSQVWGTGGSGFSGGKGGSLTVTADKAITLPSVYLYGGNASGVPGTGGAADQIGQSGHGGQLSATSTSGAVALGYTDVEGGYGSSLAAGGGGGSIVLDAGTTVSATDSWYANGGSGQDANGGQGGSIQATAGGDANLRYLYASGGYSSNSTAALTSGGVGGNITINSTTGNIAFGTSAGSLSVYGGATAGGGAGYGNANGGQGGIIALTATGTPGGQVLSTDALQADGGYSDSGIAGGGGSVTVHGRTDMMLTSVSVRGGSAGPAGGGLGGTIDINTPSGSVTANQLSADGQAGGGTISVLSGGNITLGGASVSGDNYSSSLGSAGGGAGGAITLLAQNTAAGFGNITVTGTLDASGGMGENGGNGGNGGSVTVQADKSVHLAWVNVPGGGASVAPGAGGAAGSVLLASATAGVTVDGQIWAPGGSGDTGGKGGTVTIQAPGDISVGGAYSGYFGIVADGGHGSAGAGGQGGDVALSSSGGSLDIHDSAGSYGITAAGGDGAPGGMGGTITLQAAVDVNAANIQAFGGNGAPDGAAGGQGGAIAITLGGTLAAATTTIDASGGNGANGSATVPTGGAGGDGGTVSVVKPAGDLSLANVTGLASGGSGGTANMDGTSLGGAGGAGGTVTMESTLGSLALAGGSLSSSAGFSGANGDDATSGPDRGVGMTNLHAAGDMDLTGDLFMYRSGLTALAGGNLAVNSAITTAGGAVKLSAGDPAFGTASNPSAVLDVFAPIDTTSSGSFAGAPVSLAATGAVMVDVSASTNRLLAFAATDTSSSVTGSVVTVNAPQVVVSSTSALVGTTGGVQVTTDSLQLDGSIDAGTGVASIQALTPTTSVHLGGTDEVNTLNLDAGELSRINAGRLVIGDTANTGGLSVDSAVAVNPQLVLQTGGTLTLNGVVTGNYTDATAPAGTANSIVLAANSYSVGASGGLAIDPSTRWLAYVAGPLAGNNFGTLQSNNLALWGRTYAGSPPESVTETGNRYLFAFQPTLAVDAPSVSHVYDGTTNVNLQENVSGLVDAASYGNVFLQDQFSGLIAVPGLTKNVGTYAITQGDLQAPTGYAFSFTGGNVTITPRALNVSAVAGVNKVYDGTTAASTGASTDDRISGDELTVGATGAFADKNAGTAKTVNLSNFALSGADAANYTVGSTPTSTTADITPRGLNVSAVAGVNKVYDGTTAASVGAATDDRISGDVLAVGATGAFADKNAGTAKTVSLSNFSLSGTDAGNYVLVNAPTATQADITPRALTITSIAANNKVYDATTTASTGAATDNRISGDNFVVSAAANFADPNAGTGKTVHLGGVTLTGADAQNYTVQSAPATSKADITPAPLTIQANNQGKAQGTEFTFNGTEFSATGLKGGDTVASVSLASDGAPAAAAVGAYPIFATNAAGGSGFSAGNYSISYLNGALAVASPTSVQQVQNQVVTFATLFVQEAFAQSDPKPKGKDDIVVTDQCRP
ncbi:filamentous hemagglutinin N-terminal domain-containing protein [Ramlibacter sp. G-1-2-2]|uniref:Filamentous hemagglutinin N-terminal domain-containing protein n=1 Tax=Ramlibacter agri TaxID=2728837 RepID=A0A848GVY3_9BURK|nr:YDG domain-containing protein [Ramlibacter agri]NML42775.1 filamentous hemagglutinin N-terminal domain-containing protein [Ramlibacter agri]